MKDKTITRLEEDKIKLGEEKEKEIEELKVEKNSAIEKL